LTPKIGTRRGKVVLSAARRKERRSAEPKRRKKIGYAEEKRKIGAPAALVSPTPRRRARGGLLAPATPRQGAQPCTARYRSQILDAIAGTQLQP